MTHPKIMFIYKKTGYNKNTPSFERKFIMRPISRFFLFVTAVLAFSACSANTPSGKEIGATSVSGYFFKNSNPLPDAVNYFVMDDEKTFSRYFQIGRTMSAPQSIDFTKRIIGIVAKPTDIETKIVISKVTVNETAMNVTYRIEKGDKQSYQIIPTTLIEVDQKNIKNVTFTLEK